MTSVSLMPRLSGIVTTSATFQYANVLRNTEYTVALLYSISASSLNVPCEYISVMLCLRIPSMHVFVDTQGIMSLQLLVGFSFIILLLFSFSFSWNSLAMVISGAPMI